MKSGSIASMCHQNIGYIFAPCKTSEDTLIVTVENDQIVSGEFGIVKDIKNYGSFSLGKFLQNMAKYKKFFQ